MDSTGLKLCGADEWLTEKHGTRTRRSWKKLHLGVDATAQVGPVLNQVEGPVAAFVGEGGYDQDRVYAEVAQRHPNAAVAVPPRATTVPSEAAETAPTQRDNHLRLITAHGRRGWKRRPGYGRRSRAEAAIGRWKRVIGGMLHSRKKERRATEVAIAARALNRMLALGRPKCVRIA